MIKKMILPVMLGLVIYLGFGSSVSAFSINMTGTVAGGSVNVWADFTPGDNSMVVEVWNATFNPGNVGQNISDLFFVLGTGQTAGTLTESLGLERTVNSDGTFSSSNSEVSTGWLLNNSYTLGSATGLRLYDLGAAGPRHTILGLPDGTYSAANPSIAGNVPHNPFLFGTADAPVTFTITIPGVTIETNVSYVNFSFGTTEGIWLNPPPTGFPAPIPEPATLLLLGLGLVGLAELRRKKG